MGYSGKMLSRISAKRRTIEKVQADLVWQPHGAPLLILCKPSTMRRLVMVAALTLLSGCNSSDQSASNGAAAKVVAAESADIESLDTSNGQVEKELPPIAQIATAISEIVDTSDLAGARAEQWSAARFATAGTIAAAQQRPGDSEEGRRALVEEPYVSCGIPERVYRQLLTASEATPIEGRYAEADGLPYSVNVSTNNDDVRIVSNNCLTCHGTELFGELVVGLGNEFLDFTNDASLLVERAGALVQGEDETRAWELYADRIGAIAPYMRPHTVGVNPANNLTFALIAHRRAKDNAWSETPLLPLPPTDVPPVSVPPWWRMAKKPAMFNLGEGRLDHARIMMAASMLCTDTPQELEVIDAYAPDIRAYIASLTPPAYPFPVDQGLADAGGDVFRANCSHCHGNYEGEGDYPARLVPIDIVQTDSTLVDFAHGPGLPYIDWFNRSYYGELSTAAPGPGYVAPPLDGIWATGPFLHNGSVPTIAMVLESGQRPRYWQHDVRDASDKASYDQVRLGWAHTVLDIGKSAASDVHIYDTDKPGYANVGHLFGDHLSDDERVAVIEYLKTL